MPEHEREDGARTKEIVAWMNAGAAALGAAALLGVGGYLLLVDDGVSPSGLTPSIESPEDAAPRSAADIDTRPPGVSPPAAERPTVRAAEDSPNLARSDRRRSAEPAAPRLAADTDARAPGASPPAAEGPTARAAEDSLNLARADRRRIKVGLTASGLEPGPADGMFGVGTRSAIRDWQAGRGLPATGYLNAAEAEELIALGRGRGEGRRAEARRPSAVVEDSGGSLAVRAEPVRVGGNISPPTKTRDVQPRYPEEARAARVQGVVILEATIGSTGVVTDVSVLRSVPLLDDAAIAAVLQWQYTPTLLNGVPVPVIMTVTVNFSLR